MKITIPPNGGIEGAVSKTQAAAPCRYLGAGNGWFLEELPAPRMPKGGKGVRTMSFSDVAVLLTLIGGTIFVTFQITWKIATSDKKRKKK